MNPFGWSARAIFARAAKFDPTCSADRDVNLTAGERPVAKSATTTIIEGMPFAAGVALPERIQPGLQSECFVQRHSLSFVVDKAETMGRVPCCFVG